MDETNSMVYAKLQQTQVPESAWKNTQESMVRVLSLVGCLAGAVLLAYSLLSFSKSNDLFPLITGGVVLVFGVLIFLMRKISSSTRANLLAFLFLTMTQMLFLHFGWSGQSLLPWLVSMIATSAMVNARTARIWSGLGVIALLVWFLLASTGHVPRIIVITQNTVLVDTLLLLFAAAVGNLLIGMLKNALTSSIHNLFDVQESSRQEIEQSQVKVIELEHRLADNAAADSIVRKLNSILDPTLLIQRAAELIKETFDLYYVGVFLIDPAHEYAVLRYGTGEEGKRMVANRHRLAVGGYSMIGWTTQTHQSRIALDVGEEAVHFDNPDLPETRSEVSLPLQTENGILGALSIQSDRSNAFSQDQINLLQQLADSLAIALERSTTFDRTRSTLEEIRVINRAFVQQSWGERLDASGQMKVAYENPQGVSEIEQSSIVKVPLILRNEVIGTINLEVEGDQLQAEQLEFMQAISSQVTSALENARLLEETQRAAAQEQKLNQISSQFSRAQSIDEILRTAVAEFGKLPSVAEASISLIPPDLIESNPDSEIEAEVNP